MNGKPQIAMTLVEVLVAIAIGAGLLLLAAFAQHNIGTAVYRSRALAGLHLQAATLNDRLQGDIGTWIANVGARLEYGGDGGMRLVFMRAMGFEAMSRSDKGSLALNQNDEYADHHVWVAWEFDVESGGLRRAESPPLAYNHTERGVLGHGNGDSPYSSTVPASQGAAYNDALDYRDDLVPTAPHGRMVVPVRRMRWFFNAGDHRNPTRTESEAQVAAWLWGDRWSVNDIYPIPMHAAYGGDWGYFDPFIAYTGPRHYLIGNEGLISDAYGSELPPPLDAGGTPAGDAVSYNKNRLHLLGVPGRPDDNHYPTGLERIARNVELMQVALVRHDGSVLEDTGAVAVHDIDGYRLQPEGYLYEDLAPRIRAVTDPAADLETLLTAFRRDRPKTIRVTYLMHDVPEAAGRPYKEDPTDPDFGGYDPASINYLRHVFYDELAPSLAPAERHKTFQRLIESRGRTAIIVRQSFAAQ